MSRKIGRPSKYSLQLALEICARIADGESVLQICKDPAMPSQSTFYSWLLAANDEFPEKYALAQECRAHKLFDEILSIADDPTHDWVERTSKDGEESFIVGNQDHINRSRLRVDTRKWMAGKLAAKKYGDKITQEHTGEAGGPIVVRLLPYDSKGDGK